MAANAATDAAVVTVAARLDRLPPSGYTRKLIVLISMGGWFEFYDLFFTAAVGRAGQERHSSSRHSGPARSAGLASFVARSFLGLFIGTIAFSWLSDRFGRRSIFTFALLWYSIGSFILAFQQTAFGVDLWRMIACIGLGVELVNVDTYVSELVPRSGAGRLSPSTRRHVHRRADDRAARLSHGAALHLPRVRGLALGGHHRLRGRDLHLVDPPRPAGIAALAGAAWQVRRGRPHRRRDGAPPRAESGRPLPPPQLVAGEGEVKRGAWSEMWNDHYRGRTIMLVVYNLLQTIGYYGFQLGPAIPHRQGDQRHHLARIHVHHRHRQPGRPAHRHLVCRQVRAQMADRLGGARHRRVRPAVRAADMLLLLAFGILITLSANWLSFSFHAYQAELYPTRIRAQAVGFVYSWSRFSTIFSPFLIPFFLRNYGPVGVFSFIAAAMVVVFIVIGFFGPKVTRLRLEAIAA